MMFAVIVWFFKQLFNSNGDDKCSHSPPKSRKKITHVRPLVNSWMVSPRLKSRPGIFSNSHLLSLGIHFSRDRREKESVYHNLSLLASSSSSTTNCLGTKPGRAFLFVAKSSGIPAKHFVNRSGEYELIS